MGEITRKKKGPKRQDRHFKSTSPIFIEEKKKNKQIFCRKTSFIYHLRDVGSVGTPSEIPESDLRDSPLDGYCAVEVEELVLLPPAGGG